MLELYRGQQRGVFISGVPEFSWRNYGKPQKYFRQCA